MRTSINWLYRGLQALLTFLMAILIIPVTMQILARFTDLIPNYIWTEEMARMCLIWIIMLGASVAVRDGTHFDVDVLAAPKTIKGKAIGAMIVHVAIILMALIFVGFGWRFASFGYIQNSEMTGINMITMYIAWPLAGVIWLLFGLEHLADDLKLYGRGGDVPR